MADFIPSPAYSSFPSVQTQSHPSQTHTAAPSSGTRLDRDADFLIQSFLPPVPPPSPPEHSGIHLPFCSPQIAGAYDSPFARGYNPALQNVGISQEQLLAFIDGLNCAMTASPPLRVLTLPISGAVIGFVPYHWAMIAGNAMQLVAEAGMYVLSNTLSDRYLRAANLRLFQPKGLAVRICTTAAMQHLVMRTGSGAGPTILDKIGRGVGSALLRAPIPLPYTSRIVRAIADKPPKVQASISGIGDGRTMPLSTQRRLAALEGYALTLHLDVPPPAKVKGVMEAMRAWGVALESRRTGKKENKAEKRRMKLARVEEQLQRLGTNPYGSPHQHIGGGASGYTSPPAYREGAGYRSHTDTSASSTSRLGGGVSGYPESPQYGRRLEYGRGHFQMSDAELHMMGRRERKELRKAARLRRKQAESGPGLIGSLIGPTETKLERRVADADLLEHWESDKVLWIVIMSTEMDRELQAMEKLDSVKNEEHIDARTWEAQIIKERDALEEEEEMDSDNDYLNDKR
ncbi:hypothetical protein C8R47DRAFT_1198686 [Mycena vitilis]|nr:hypothetical protein C8R47DRAFT_1198686 [Mycena vitilis]